MSNADASSNNNDDDIEIIEVPPDSSQSGDTASDISYSPRLRAEERTGIRAAGKVTPKKRSSSVGSSSSNGSNDVVKSSLVPKRRKVEKQPPTVTGKQNDCYCWICHKEGTVFSCMVCPRAYHQRCASEVEFMPDWVCPECCRITAAENVDTRSECLSEISLEKFCMLLKCSLSKLKCRSPAAFHQPVPVEYYSSYLDYVIHPMDLSSIEKNIKNKIYGCTESFLADVKWIQHNSCVFNGSQHPLTLSAKSLVKTCEVDMAEIEVCPDCFLHASTRNKYWFSDICRKPHPLVWAKLKGFPYWPAKVVRIQDFNVDARFFGAHDRAWVPIAQCYHLSKEMPTTSKPKKKGNYEIALEELNVHVGYLRQKYGVFEYAPYRTVFDPKNKSLMYHGIDVDKALIKDYKQCSSTVTENDDVEKLPATSLDKAPALDSNSSSDSKFENKPHIQKLESLTKEESSNNSSDHSLLDTDDLNVLNTKKKNAPAGVFEISNAFKIDSTESIETKDSCSIKESSSPSEDVSVKKIESALERLKELFSINDASKVDSDTPDEAERTCGDSMQIESNKESAQVNENSMSSVSEKTLVSSNQISAEKNDSSAKNDENQTSLKAEVADNSIKIRNERENSIGINLQNKLSGFQNQNILQSKTSNSLLISSEQSTASKVQNQDLSSNSTCASLKPKNVSSSELTKVNNEDECSVNKVDSFILTLGRTIESCKAKLGITELAIDESSSSESGDEDEEEGEEEGEDAVKESDDDDDDQESEEEDDMEVESESSTESVNEESANSSSSGEDDEMDDVTLPEDSSANKKFKSDVEDDVKLPEVIVSIDNSTIPSKGTAQIEGGLNTEKSDNESASKDKANVFAHCSSSNLDTMLEKENEQSEKTSIGAVGVEQIREKTTIIQKSFEPESKKASITEENFEQKNEKPSITEENVEQKNEKPSITEGTVEQKNEKPLMTEETVEQKSEKSSITKESVEQKSDNLWRIERSGEQISEKMQINEASIQKSAKVSIIRESVEQKSEKTSSEKESSCVLGLVIANETGELGSEKPYSETSAKLCIEKANLCEIASKQSPVKTDTVKTVDEVINVDVCGEDKKGTENGTQNKSNEINIYEDIESRYSEQDLEGLYDGIDDDVEMETDVGTTSADKCTEKIERDEPIAIKFSESIPDSKKVGDDKDILGVLQSEVCSDSIPPKTSEGDKDILEILCNSKTYAKEKEDFQSCLFKKTIEPVMMEVECVEIKNAKLTENKDAIEMEDEVGKIMSNSIAEEKEKDLQSCLLEKRVKSDVMEIDSTGKENDKEAKNDALVAVDKELFEIEQELMKLEGCILPVCDQRKQTETVSSKEIPVGKNTTAADINTMPTVVSKAQKQDECETKEKGDIEMKEMQNKCCSAENNEEYLKMENEDELLEALAESESSSEIEENGKIASSGIQKSAITQKPSANVIDIIDISSSETESGMEEDGDYESTTPNSKNKEEKNNQFIDLSSDDESQLSSTAVIGGVTKGTVVTSSESSSLKFSGIEYESAKKDSDAISRKDDNQPDCVKNLLSLLDSESEGESKSADGCESAKSNHKKNFTVVNSQKEENLLEKSPLCSKDMDLSNNSILIEGPAPKKIDRTAKRSSTLKDNSDGMQGKEPAVHKKEDEIGAIPMEAKDSYKRKEKNDKVESILKTANEKMPMREPQKSGDEVSKLKEMMKDLKEKLRLSKLKYDTMVWYHLQEKRELKHNMNLILLEMRASFDADKKGIIESLKKSHEDEKAIAVFEAKGKQWCAVCKEPAIFHCCWNTSYCSYACQKHHWPEHRYYCTQVVKRLPSTTKAVTEYVKIAKKPSATEASEMDNPEKKVIFLNIKPNDVNQPTVISPSVPSSLSSQLSSPLTPSSKIETITTSQLSTSLAASKVQFITSKNKNQLHLVSTTASTSSGIQTSGSLSFLQNTPVQFVLTPVKKSDIPVTVTPLQQKSVQGSADIITKVRNRQTDLNTAIHLLTKMNKETEENLKKKKENEDATTISPDDDVPVSFAKLESILPTSSETDCDSSDKTIDKKPPNDTTADDDVMEVDKEENDSKDEMVSLADGIEISKKTLDKCLRIGVTPTKLTRCLVDILFTDIHVLANSCVFGRKSNVTKQTRPALHPETVNAILDFVISKFPSTQRTDVVSAMNLKCKEARRFLSKGCQGIADSPKESELMYLQNKTSSESSTSEAVKERPRTPIKSLSPTPAAERSITPTKERPPSPTKERPPPPTKETTSTSPYVVTAVVTPSAVPVTSSDAVILPRIIPQLSKAPPTIRTVIPARNIQLVPNSKVSLPVTTSTGRIVAFPKVFASNIKPQIAIKPKPAVVSPEKLKSSVKTTPNLVQVVPLSFSQSSSEPTKLVKAVYMPTGQKVLCKVKTANKSSESIVLDQCQQTSAIKQPLMSVQGSSSTDESRRPVVIVGLSASHQSDAPKSEDSKSTQQNLVTDVSQSTIRSFLQSQGTCTVSNALRKSVTQVLHQLSPEKVEHVVATLMDRDVTKDEDLNMIKEEDLENVLKPIEIRKLINHWLSNGVFASEDGANQSSEAEQIVPSVEPLISNASSAIADSNLICSFKIPWDKFPSDLMEFLNKGERPYPLLRKTMVRIIVDAINETCKSPGKTALSFIAKSVVEKYPNSFSDMICGELIGSGHDSLLKQLQTRIDNAKRSDAFPLLKRCAIQNDDNTEGELIKKRRVIMAETYACVAWQPSLPKFETKITQLEKKEELKKLHGLDTKARDPELRKKLLTATFCIQRMDINSGMSIDKLAEEWPYLFTKEGLLLHFEKLVGIELEGKLSEAIKCKGEKLFKCLRSVPPFSKRKSLLAVLEEVSFDIQLEAVCLAEIMLLIMGYFGESREVLFKTITDAVIPADLPATPCLIVCEGTVLRCTKYMLCIDEIVVNDAIGNFCDAFLLLFASFYCFNYEYPLLAGLTLEFVQRCFFNINPDRGTKQSNACTRHNVISHKVLRLINSVADFEMTHKLITDGKDIPKISAALRKSVAQVLCQLSPKKVEQVVATLMAMGVTKEADMSLIKEEELKGLLKPIEIRKLLSRLSPETAFGALGNVSQLPESKHVSSSELSNSSHATADCSCSNNFEIPWGKMPTDLMESLNSGERPHPSMKISMIRIIADAVKENCKFPCKKTLLRIANSIIEMYPKSFRSLHAGSGQDSLLKQLQLQLENVNRFPAFGKLKWFEVQSDRNIDKQPVTDRESSISNPTHVTAIPSWFCNFKMPWDKMPTDLLKSLNKGERPHPVMRIAMIHIIADTINEACKFPENDTLSCIVKSIIEKYPKSFNDKFSGLNVGSVHDSLLRQLRLRIDNLNRSPVFPKLNCSEIQNDENLEGEQTSTSLCNFEITWDKMPSDLIESLNKGDTPHPVMRIAMINIIADTVNEVCKFPGKETLSCIVKSIIEKYPKSFDDKFSGLHIGSVHDSLLRQLELRIDNLNKLPVFHKSNCSKIQKNENVEYEQSSTWLYNFKIPWDKMPTNLMESLNKGESPHPLIRIAMIHVIADTIHETCKFPEKETLSRIVKSIIDKYPKSFDDKFSSWNVGSTRDSLLRQLQLRMDNLNRFPAFCKSSYSVVKNNESEQTIERKVRTVERDTCIAWQPPLPKNETESTQLKKKKELKEIYHSGRETSKPDLGKRRLLASTFYTQRKDINKGMRIDELVEEWPHLFSEEGVLLHFEQLVGIELKRMFSEAIKCKGESVVQYVMSVPAYSSKKSVEAILTEISLVQQQETAFLGKILLLILDYFGEEREILFKAILDVETADDVEKREDLPATPCLIVCKGTVLTSTKYMLCIDGKVVNDAIDNFCDGFLLLFASFYCFNIEYPLSASLTLEFVQRCFCNINLDRTNQRKISARHNVINSKVLTFINSIADYELIHESSMDV